MEIKKPLRRCVGCMTTKEKKSLIRVVKADEGFKLDYTGKLNGRGAYICNDLECLNRAIKNKGLSRSFKCEVPSDVYDSLREEFHK